jgi:hypothetical protein
MTDERPRPPSVFRKLRDPAALNYLVVAGAGLLVYGLIMMARGNDIGAIIAVLLALPGILARWTAAPVLILLMTTYLLIDPGFYNLVAWVTGGPRFFGRTGGGFDLEDVLLAAGLLAYTLGHFRLTSLIHQGMPNEPTAQRPTDPANPPRRPPHLVGPDELPRTLIVGGCCVIGGQLAWTILVLVERAGRPRPADFTTGTARLLLLAWVFGLALMVASAALVYLRANRMTQAEAAMALRDEFFLENRRETDRLQRWRRWFKERMALRRRAGK